MKVEVVRDGLHYFCTTDEQLAVFLESGYTKVEPKVESPKKAKETTVKKTR